MKIPFLGWLIDERFLEHRRRALGAGAIAGVVASVGLFEYRWFVQHLWSWDLFTVAATMVAVKMATFAWYRLRD